MIGWSSGLLLEMTGGSMSRGRRRWACDTLLCTSCRARSTLRDRFISRVMLAPPMRDEEVMVFTPSTWISASSRISTTSFSMTSGAAPSQVTETEMLGKSTSGNWLMPMREPATRPKTMVAAIIIQASTGFLTQISVIFMFRLLGGAPRSLDGLASRLFWPRQGRRPGAPARRRSGPRRRAPPAVRRPAARKAPPLAVGGAHARCQDALHGLAVLHHEGQETLLAGADGRLRHDRQGAGIAHRHASPRRTSRSAASPWPCR